MVPPFLISRFSDPLHNVMAIWIRDLAPPTGMTTHTVSSTTDLTTWHCRLGHLNTDAVSLMHNNCPYPHTLFDPADPPLYLSDPKGTRTLSAGTGFGRVGVRVS